MVRILPTHKDAARYLGRFKGIWWTPNTGPHPIIAAGILNDYRNRGAENSNLGYPLNDTGTNSTGKYTQQFQGGWLETTQY